MWFLPFSVGVTPRGIIVPRHEIWFLRLVQRLLAGDRAALKLLGENPFPERPPRFLRAQYYRYRMATSEERRKTGGYWERTSIGEYLPPIGATAGAEP
jgi:hypothetical protein